MRWVLLIAAAAIVPACHDDDDDASGPLTISLKGGNASAGSGANGGYFDVTAYNGSDVGVLTSGSVDTTQPFPAFEKPFLGSNPLIVSSSATLAVGSGPNGSFLANNSNTVSNVTGTVTGLWILPGVTLTIKPNRGGDGAVPHTLVSLNFAEGVFIEGTLKTALMDSALEGDSAGVNTANFYLQSCNSFVTAPGSVIDLRGLSNGAGAGGNGGYFSCYNNDFVHSYATIMTDGGDGSTNGGNGGEIDFESDWGPFINFGNASNNGGNGANGTGGNSDYVYFYADDYSFLYNSGNVSSRGGNGTLGGGNGGNNYWYSSDGPITNAGSILTYGGNATVSGNAGYGGYVYFYCYGRLRHNGTVDTHGGTATAGNGGYGGYVDMESYTTYPYAGSYLADSGGIWFGGAVTTDGGDGTTGAGYAGYFYMYADYWSTTGPNKQPVYLVGYSTINNSGGNGSVNGGNAGGNNDLNSWYTYDDVSTYWGGNVINQANVISRGGDGATGTGGASSRWDLETEDQIYPPYNYGVTNSGSFDISGGNGGTSGGAAGNMYWWADFFLENSGSITANGGNGGTGNGAQGSGWIELYCRTTNNNSGAVTTNGGSSVSGNGGMGGYIYIYGQVNNSSTLTSMGGNSTSATGGNGGYIELYSDLAPSIYAAFNVAAGSGAVGTPVIGDVYVDGRHLVGP